jgi:hypothetical protein
MTKGPTVEGFRRLIHRPIFSYGTVDKRGNLELRKPDGSVGLVDFAFLARKAPEPFKSEWSHPQTVGAHDEGLPARLHRGGRSTHFGLSCGRRVN